MICYESSLRRIHVSGSEVGDRRVGVFCTIVDVLFVIKVQSSSSGNECDGS